MSKSSRQRLRRKRKLSPPPRTPAQAPQGAPAEDAFPIRPAVLRWTAAACLFGAEYIHWSVVDVHAAEWAAAGTFFTIVALSQLILAVGVGFSRDRRWLWAAVGVSTLTAVVWAISRTVGMPFGPRAAQPESLGRADTVATVLEILAITAAVALLRKPVPGSALTTGPASETRAARPRRYYALVSAVTIYVVALTGFGIFGTAGAGDHAGPAGAASTEDAVAAGEGAQVSVVAKAFTFDPDRLVLLAGRPLRLRLTNDDSVPHNVALYQPGRATPLFRSEIVDGATSETFLLDAPAPGTYEFRCDLHPQMKGVAEFNRS